MIYRVREDGTYLDRIIFDLYGKIDGYIEEIYELNRRLVIDGKLVDKSLAEYGFILEKGLELNLPDKKIENIEPSFNLFE